MNKLNNRNYSYKLISISFVIFMDISIEYKFESRNNFKKKKS